MIIDEQKMKRAADGLVSGPKGVIPSLRFRRGKTSRSNALEAARLAIGIFVAVAMLFASAALAWTLAEEAGKGIETAAAKASLRPADAGDVQVIILPKGGK